MHSNNYFSVLAVFNRINRISLFVIVRVYENVWIISHINFYKVLIYKTKKKWMWIFKLEEKEQE